jgi:hypothetical protein
MAIPINHEDFGNLFERFGRRAFRLEKLDRYSVPEEAEDYSRFIAGEPLPNSTGEDWCQFVHEKVRLGRTIQRVHIVSKPLTPYIKFEIDWRYSYSSNAGEDIYLLERAKIPSSLNVAHDFWLFDDQILILMHYDVNGSFCSVERENDPHVISAYREASISILSLATPLRQHIAQARTA